MSDRVDQSITTIRYQARHHGWWWSRYRYSEVIHQYEVYHWNENAKCYRWAFSAEKVVSRWRFRRDANEDAHMRNLRLVEDS